MFEFEPEQIESFIRDGYLKLENAFSEDLARQAQSELWYRIGLSPDAPENWQEPVIRLGFLTDSLFREIPNTPVLHAAYDALAGVGRWLKPGGLGTFPIRFPSSRDPEDTGWHVDMSFGTESPDFMKWRINIKSRGRALLMLFLLSDTVETDAPTKIRAGSHLEVARRLLPHGEEGLSLGELAEDGFAFSAHYPEVMATGKAGTVYLCHPFLVHSAQAHQGRMPRFLAQPPLLPKGEFDPDLEPSAVQKAIRRACGLA